MYCCEVASREEEETGLLSVLDERHGAFVVDADVGVEVRVRRIVVIPNKDVIFTSYTSSSSKGVV